MSLESYLGIAPAKLLILVNIYPVGVARAAPIALLKDITIAASTLETRAWKLGFVVGALALKHSYELMSSP
jgi:hypothetical protein